LIVFFDKKLQDRDLIKADQKELVPYLNVIMEPRFTGRGHWENAPIYRVLMSLIRKRPRDLIKLCTLAGRRAGANGRKIISTSDFEGIFEEYSQGRLQDTTNEYRSELHDIERLLLGMKPAKRYRTTKEGFVYTTDELLNKIGRIIEQGIFRFTNGEIADKKQLAAFLYKINFLTARKDQSGLIERKYFEENRYLSNKFIDFGFSWEVHPAYRWALQPDDQKNIFNDLELTTKF
jgi:hypothetical protein